ncbi:MAG TPA: hypothetical protein IAC41_11685, partial [Candidatus Merdenecus merdavium]|nr:hypothetical protein [Candidatus Merdenecus merdavium]
MINWKAESKKIVITVLLIFLAVLLYKKTTGVYTEMKRYSDVLWISFPSNGVEKEKVDSIIIENNQGKNNKHMTIWKELANQSITNPDLYRNVNVDMIIIAGKANLLFNTSINLEEDDEKGCVISQSLAKKLFGDINVKNCKVIYQEEEFLIRDVLEKQFKGDLIAIRPGSHMELPFDSMIVEKQNVHSSSLALQNKIFQQYELEGVLVEFDLFTEFIAFYLLMPIALITFLFVKYSLSDKQKELSLSGKFLLKPRFYVGIKVTIGIIVILFWILNLREILWLSDDVIPSAWSDFDFFQNLFNEKSEALIYFLQKSKGYFELQYVLNTFKIFLLNF